jgi:hypothetical protein
MVRYDQYSTNDSMRPGLQVRIGIEVKSWIRIGIKVIIQELHKEAQNGAVEVWRVVDAQNRGAEAQNEARRVLEAQKRVVEAQN